jgi:haloalkane dehalogenase
MGEKGKISAEFPFEPNYAMVRGSRMHYVDEGVGKPVLFLHGNPTSSYLWRNIIPHVLRSSRCIAPDLIGMGKSDKPDIEYGFFDHLAFLEGFIEELRLEDIILVVHDWGSALGFYYAMRHEDNVRGLAFMEAILAPVPGWEDWPEPARRIFQGFRSPDVGWDLIVNRNFFVERILPSSIIRRLSEEEMGHYREPYLDPPSRKPLWRWPNQIPIAGEPADVVEAVTRYAEWLKETNLPKLLFHARPGFLIEEPMVDWCRKNLKNLKAVYTGKGIHFIQEDNPYLIGRELAAWIEGLD